MTAVTTFDPGKAVVKILAIEKTVDDLFNVRPPKTELFGKTLVVNPCEFLN